MIYEHHTQMSRRDFDFFKKLNSFYFDVDSENRTLYLDFSSYSKRKVEVFPGTSISSWMGSVMILLFHVVHGFDFLRQKVIDSFLE